MHHGREDPNSRRYMTNSELIHLDRKLPKSMKACDFFYRKQVLNSSVLIGEETRDTEYGN
jgi:hypothetical protein